MFHKKVVEKIKTNLLCSITFFLNCAVYETMWKHIAEPDLPQMTIWHMHIACWIPKATNTLSEYVIITAFPLQQRLHARTSMLCYMCIACQVTSYYYYHHHHHHHHHHHYYYYYYRINCLPEKDVANKTSDTCGANTFHSRIFQPLNLESKKVSIDTLTNSVHGH